MPLPVAVGGRRGAAFASFARMACVFLILFTPAFFFRCFWFGIVPPVQLCRVASKLNFL
jgi:hypothetical protein